ncbi:MAG: MFS transporter [Candidatus Marinimicrobia bacterium]|nr:MFS transporter [Candidatus Neomarinimicrobiota bacterium]
MAEAIKRTIRDSAGARWTALAIVSFTMFCGYLFTDVLSPLKPLLQQSVAEGGLAWTSIDFGVFAGAYGFLNVFLLMLIFSGLILDKKGIRFSLILSAAIMVIGAVLKYLAISKSFAADATTTFLFWEVKSQVFWASFGYAIFGVGVEFAGITVSKVIVKWFKGYQIALAMGLQVSFARLGSMSALAFPAIIAAKWSITTPVLLGTVLLIIGFLSFIFYTFMDKKLDKQEQDNKDLQENQEEEEGFHAKDILIILKNKGFWYIALLCVLFYGGVFPFYKFGADLFVNKFGMSPKFAGLVPSIIPIGTLALTPLFGNIYDRKGKGATIMLIGAVMLLGVHIILFIPGITSVAVGALAVIVLGIAFSLVPSAMWPSVPKIIPEHLLGTAFALIFYIQNIGLMLIPFFLGIVLDKSNPGVAAQIASGQDVVYNYTVTMSIFVVLAALAVIVAIGLKRDDKKEGFGLELPNIEH